MTPPLTLPPAVPPARSERELDLLNWARLLWRSRLLVLTRNALFYRSNRAGPRRCRALSTR